MIDDANDEWAEIYFFCAVFLFHQKRKDMIHNHDCLTHYGVSRSRDDFAVYNTVLWWLAQCYVDMSAHDSKI